MANPHLTRRAVGKALAFGAAACAGAPLSTFAQGVSERQTRLIVPFPPGGGTDSTARLLATKLGEIIGMPVVVDNRTGASGTIGIGATAKLPNDGLNLVLGQADNLAVAPLLIKGVPYDPLTSLTPIAHVADVPILIVTLAEQPYKTMADVVKAAKADPKAITFASAGVGTTPHLSGELLSQALGVTMSHVAYKGSAPALTDVLGGRVTMLFTSISLVVPHLKAGKLRALAITSAKRSSALPDVPTIAEALNLPGFDTGSWYGIFGPAGIPREIVTRLNADINKVLATPEMKAFLETQEGAAIKRTTPEALAQQLRADIQKWDRVIKQAKITLE
jgi:tripartite-type tricarboxylate transporter receptor subunit TctC